MLRKALFCLFRVHEKMIQLGFRAIVLYERGDFYLEDKSNRDRYLAQSVEDDREMETESYYSGCHFQIGGWLWTATCCCTVIGIIDYE